jgi:hypothetical protein
MNKLREICARNQREQQDSEPRRLRLEVMRLRQQQYRVKEAEDAMRVSNRLYLVLKNHAVCVLGSIGLSGKMDELFWAHHVMILFLPFADA